MGTGENSGTWGTITNTNLGTALEEAIVGSADVNFSSADVTLTLTDTNSSQSARNLRLNLTGSVGAPQNLIVPAIEKVYIINNGLTQTITVKNSGGTGISVPAGKTEYVYNNGTNVVEAINHLTSLTLDTPLPVASGGTGSNTGINASTSVTGVLPVANGGTGSNSATFSGANITSLNATAVSSGTLDNARTSAASANGASTIVARDASGNFTANTATLTTVTGAGSGLTSLNAANISSGTLAVARGGTGAATLTANNVLLGNGTSALQVVAPGSSGNILTSNGTTWESTAPAGGGVTSLNGQTGAITNTTLDAIGSYIAAVAAANLPTGTGGTLYNQNDTIAGSTLRRNYNVDGGSQTAFPGTSAYGGRNYNGGGTALSGTWRCMGRTQGGAYDPCTNTSTMNPGMWVRIS